MSNSSLVVYTKISPNRSSPRSAAIDTITIHHMAGKLSIETCGEVFQPTSRQASSNYGIGNDGRIGMYVEEKDRAWTTSSRANDNRAVTIEVANSAVGNASGWPISDAAMKSLIALCVDICKRNNIKKLNFTGDKTGNLTMHKWFASTLCPGPYLEGKFQYIADEVNKQLDTASSTPAAPAPVTDKDDTVVIYRVQTGAFSKKINALNLAEKVEAAGFQTYIAFVDNMYKVQVGAYSKKENATAQAAKLKAAGFKTYIVANKSSVVEVDPYVKEELKLLDKVKMSNGAPVYGTSRVFQSWVYNATLYVRDVNGDAITVSTLKTGAITGVVHKKYLTKL